MKQPRQSQLDAVELDATLAPDGSVAVIMTATFADPQGGILPIPKPLLGTTRDIVVDGQAVEGQAEFETISIPVTGQTATATYVMERLTGEAADVTIVDVPVLASPSDASRQDPPVRVDGTLHLPSGAVLAGDPVWSNGMHADMQSDGDAIEFSGDSPIWLSSGLIVGLEPGVVASSMPFATQPFEARRQQAITSTEQLERTLDEQDFQFELAEKVLVGVCLAIALYLGISFIWTNTAQRRDRRRRLAAGPKYTAEPPSSLSPDLVAVLVGFGKRLDQDAVAGTVLDLVHRRMLVLDGYGLGRWVLRVPPEAQGATTAEQVVIDALRAQAPAGEIIGPPLWPDRDPHWWKGYRHDVLSRAKDQKLIERRFRFIVVGPFLAGIVGCTWPLWLDDVDQIWIVPALCILGGLVFAIPLGGGFKLTNRGFDELLGWLGLGRYVRDHAELQDLDPAAIAVWGPYLSYSVVLGEAPQAAAALAPEGGREKGSRRESAAVNEAATSENLSG